MTGIVSSTPNKLREISDEGELVISTICPTKTNQSSQSVDSSLILKSWTGPIQKHSWEDLPNCMEFIVKNGSTGNRTIIWAQRTLDLLSPTATPEQLIHILNGYADLYKLVLYVIVINDNAPVGQNDIRTFAGTSSKEKQEKHHRNIVFIVHNSENSKFAPLYTTRTDGRPQTCYATDDARIINDIQFLLRQWNQQIPQRTALELNPISIRKDAMENTDGSQTKNNLDSLLPSLVQNESALSATLKLCENDIQHTQSNSCSDDQPIKRSLQDPIIVSSNSSAADSTKKRVLRNLDYMDELVNHVRRLDREFEDTPSMETDDRSLPTDKTLNRQNLTAQHDMINTLENKSRNTRAHIPSSDSDRPNMTICLQRSTTEPTTPTITVSNDQRISVPVQSLDAPNIKKQPRRHRHIRMLTDLAKGKCPYVQAGEKKAQQCYPVVEVPNEEGINLRVRAVTENHHLHPYTTPVSENATVDWSAMKSNTNERTCLKYDLNSFDPTFQCVYLPITLDERMQRQKIIKVRLLNWKHQGPINQEIIKHENLELCRLEFYFCTRIGVGEYQLISQPSYTTIIELKNADVTIDSENVKPQQLCERGGETISMPLSAICPKKGLSIESNGDELLKKDFTIERKILSFTSPPKKQGIDDLHLVVKRKVYVEETSMQEEIQIYDEHLPYVIHGQCEHVHPPTPLLTVTDIQTASSR